MEYAIAALVIAGIIFFIVRSRKSEPEVPVDTGVGGDVGGGGGLNIDRGKINHN